MIKVRKATLKDIALLITFWRKISDEHNKMDPDKPEFKVIKRKKDSRGISAKIFKDAIMARDSIIFIAEYGKIPVGYAKASVKNMEGFNGKIGDIHDLFVAKEFRGEGASSALKNKCFAWLRAKKALRADLNVNYYNKKAQNIYKRWGFVEASIRMRKKL